MLWEHFHIMTNLIDLAYNTTPEKYIEIILSSGDYFPGFYRFTMGSRKIESGQLTINGFIKSYFGEKRTRDSWMNFMVHRLKSLDERLKNRSDYAVYEMLDQKYKEWVYNSSEYDIVMVETQNKKQLEKDTTYFFMGALIRFTDDFVLLGYDDFRNDSVEKIPVKYETVENIINRIYENNFPDLFLPAQIVGVLKFENGLGELISNESIIEKMLMVDEQSVLFASNRDVSKKLSMRWAKDICLSDE